MSTIAILTAADLDNCCYDSLKLHYRQPVVLQTCPTHDMEEVVRMGRTTEGSRAIAESQAPGRVQR